MGQVISAGILLVVVVAIYIAVSYKHEKSGLGKVNNRQFPGWRLFFFANFINKSSKRNQHYNKFKQV